jgi:hypothetical protein
VAAENWKPATKTDQVTLCSSFFSCCACCYFCVSFRVSVRNSANPPYVAPYVNLKRFSDWNTTYWDKLAVSNGLAHATISSDCSSLPYSTVQRPKGIVTVWNQVNYVCLSQGFGSVSRSGSAWIRINLMCWIRIRIQIADPDPGGQK